MRHLRDYLLFFLFLLVLLRISVWFHGRKLASLFYHILQKKKKEKALHVFPSVHLFMADAHIRLAKASQTRLPSCPMYKAVHILWVLWLLFETGSHRTQAVLKLCIWPRLTLNFWSCCQANPALGLHASYSSTQPAKFRPQPLLSCFVLFFPLVLCLIFTMTLCGTCRDSCYLWNYLNHMHTLRSKNTSEWRGGLFLLYQRIL